MVVEIRIALIEADGEAQGVEDFDLVSPLSAGLDEAARGVAFRLAGKDGELHVECRVPPGQPVLADPKPSQCRKTRQREVPAESKLSSGSASGTICGANAMGRFRRIG